jgi:futalosine hydrolase
MAAQRSKGEPGTLVLVPTELERARLLELGGLERLEPCGFGPIAAAARTSQLLAREDPRRVLLVGIAGSLDPVSMGLGSAHSFATVFLEGVGAGEGELLRPASALGFPHWPGTPDTTLEPIGEELPLAAPVAGCPALLTVCAASTSPAQARERRARFPGALAEDMEGFGVALACALFRKPLAIVRGLSNPAGERDPARWRIADALRAAHELALELLARADWGR